MQSIEYADSVMLLVIHLQSMLLAVLCGRKECFSSYIGKSLERIKQAVMVVAIEAKSSMYPKYVLPSIVEPITFIMKAAEQLFEIAIHL